MAAAITALERAREANRQAGVCLDCGGGGVVAAMRKIARTGDPHANMRCRRCKGTGEPRRGDGDRKHSEAVEPSKPKSNKNIGDTVLGAHDRTTTD